MFSCTRNGYNSDKVDSHASMPSKSRKRFKFRVKFLLRELEGVTLSNGIFFAKIRLITGGNFAQFSKRADVKNNKVLWMVDGDQPMEFVCKLNSDINGSALSQCVLQVSVRKEEKGGKSFSKIGFAKIDLALLVHCSSMTTHQFILYPYLNQRGDNSTLNVSLMMEMIEGDIFKFPKFVPALHVVGDVTADSGSHSATHLQTVRDGSVDQVYPVVSHEAMALPVHPHAGHKRNPSNFSVQSLRVHSRNNSLDLYQENLMSCSQSSSVPLFEPPSTLEKKRSSSRDINDRIVKTRTDNYHLVKDIFHKQGIDLDNHDDVTTLPATVSGSAIFSISKS